MTITIESLGARLATSADLAGVSRALTGAFFDDRIFVWIIPDETQRRESVPAFFDLATAAFAPHGAVYTAGDGAGGALWLPPGRELVPEEEAEAFGQRIVEVSGTEADQARMAEVLELLESNHPHEPHWYLNFVGVAPASQGHGFGSALLRAVLDQADAAGQAAYLEATSPDNRRLYERHGFRVTQELTVSDCPPLYAMWREPRASRIGAG